MSRSLQEERLKIDLKLQAKDNELREWAQKQLEENYVDFNRLLQAKSIETENKMKQMLAQHKPKHQEALVKDSATGTLTDLTLKEAVDNMGMALKTDLLSLFEDDRKLKNIRFQEVFHLLESTKNLLNEHIAQQFESQKALIKAFVNKEIAERTSGDNSILEKFNKRLEGLDSLFDSKLKDEVKIMTDRLKEQTEQIEAERQANEAARLKQDEHLQKLAEEQAASVQKIQEAIAKQMEDGSLKQQEELKRLEQEVKEDVEKQKERQDDAEVKMLLQEMINKVAQDNMDVKFEEALQDIAVELDGFISKINNTTNKQYEDFNDSLKAAFEKNIT